MNKKEQTIKKKDIAFILDLIVDITEIWLKQLKKLSEGFKQ